MFLCSEVLQGNPTQNLVLKLPLGSSPKSPVEDMVTYEKAKGNAGGTRVLDAEATLQRLLGSLSLSFTVPNNMNSLTSLRDPCLYILLSCKVDDF